jgi:hypothetical protein
MYKCILFYVQKILDHRPPLSEHVIVLQCNWPVKDLQMVEKQQRKVNIPLDDKMADRIDDWRFGARIGKMTEAMRIIISKGLDVIEAEQAAQK